MTKKELKPAEWLQEIARGLEFRRKYGLEDRWFELESMLYNVHPAQANSGPNIMLSTLDALAASLNVPSPYITVKARRSDCVMKARVLESLDNLLVNEMGVQKEVERMVASGFLWGQGIAKVGYDSEFGWDSRLDIGLSNPLGLSASQYNSKFSRRLEFNSVQPGMPWVSAVLPHDFVVPWGTYSINGHGAARWCAHRIVRHLDDIKSDTKYENTRDLQPTMSMQDFVRSYQSTYRPDQMGRPELMNLGTKGGTDCEYCELWEIHDRQTGRVFVIASGHEGKFLRNQEDGLQLNGLLPFTSFSFTPRTRNFWTTPDAFYLLYHQADLSDIAVQTSVHRRLVALKMLFSQEALDEQKLKEFLSGEPGIAIGIKAGFDIDKVVAFINTPTPNIQLYQDAEIVRRNAREQVGFSKNQVGEYEATGRRTAREVNEVAQAAGLRLDRRQNAVKDFYIDTFKQVNNLIFTYWNLPRAVEVMGQDGAQLFYNVNGAMLKGEYGYNIGFSTGGNETLQERRATAFQMFLSLAQTGLFNPAALARYLVQAVNDPEFSATVHQQVLQAASGTSQNMGLQQGNGANGGATSNNPTGANAYSG